MRSLLVTAFAAILMIGGAPGNARSDVSLGLSADDEGIREFHLAIGEFYRVPEPEIVVVRQRNIPEEELPVVFFMAKRANVAPSVIIDLRLGGKSWMDITYYYGLGADIYYVETRVVSGPPYGRALGYYKNKPRKQWKYIKLQDNDIVNLVNLKFISSHYGYSPDEVIKLRSDGKNFVSINKHVKDNKGSKKQLSAKSSKSEKSGKSSKKSDKSKASKKK